MSDLPSFEVVRPYDPEVIEHLSGDEEGKALARYELERDIDLLSLPPEARPIRFVCRHLTRRQRRRCKEFPNGSYAQCELAFRYGLIRVTDVPTDTGLQAVTPHRADRLDALDDTELDGLGIEDDDIHDVGAAIYGRSVLKKGLPPRCAVPASSLDGVREALYRRAERLRQEVRRIQEEAESG